MASLEGVWISKSSENYDEYLAELGIDESSRKIIVNLKTKLTIEKNNNLWSILIENDNGIKNKVNFVSGIEFLEYTASGEEIKTCVYVDSPTKHTQYSLDEKGNLTYIISELADDDNMLMQITLNNNVQAYRHFARIK